MVGLNLHSRWPSAIKRRGDAPVLAAADPARSTVLDLVPGATSVQKADPNRVRDLLSQLVTAIEGRPLSDFVPMAQAVPLLIGLTPANVASFDEFLGSFIGTVLENGRTVEPGSVTSPADSVSANRRQLAAGSLGVKRAAAVQPGRPASVRKFDDLMAFFSDGATLAAVLGDGDDGLPPAVAEIVGAMLTAIKNNLKSGDPAAARQAGVDAATLIVAVHETFFGGETTGKAAERLRKIGKNHWLAPGFERSKKGRAHVTHVRVEDEDVPIGKAKIAGSKFVRRRRRKA